MGQQVDRDHGGRPRRHAVQEHAARTRCHRVEAEAPRTAVLTGPPLGPGTAPGGRLIAFTSALVELAVRNAGLMTAHKHAAATACHQDAERQANPVYTFWHHTSRR